MSVGNSPIKIEVNKDQSTLVTGKNGSGKSQLLPDGMCFCLYGKPYRNINKPNLINSINGKKCLVEVGFSSNGKSYLVKRGMKPTIFEIYENEKLLNQDADSRDYQKILEQQILKMNYRAFTQVVIIGTAAFVPFMKLKPEHRREFIEDLLDIRVFSVMNKHLAVKVKEVKDELKLVTAEIASAKEIIAVIEGHVESHKDDLKNKIASLKSEKQTIVDASKLIVEEKEALDDYLGNKLVSIDTMKSYQKAHEKTKETKRTIEFKRDKYVAELENLAEVCYACSQKLPHEHKETLRISIQENIDNCDKTIALCVSREVELIESYKNLSDLTQEAIQIENQIHFKNEKIYGNSLLIKKINSDFLGLENDLSKETPDKSKLKSTAKKIISLVKRKKELLETQQLQSAAQVLLHDSGIKSKIIKQYIPTINKFVNKYLNKLDLFVNFNLDENFNEVVKSRHRDQFTYDSFSEGEKTRISLALIFTWRAIAAMKNSVNANLIVLDEVADASMDTEGFDQCVNLFHSMKNNNVFVVSHREIISDKFDAVLKFEKKNNFTSITQ